MSQPNQYPIKPETPYLPLSVKNPENVGEQHYAAMVDAANALRSSQPAAIEYVYTEALDNPDYYVALADVCRDSASNPGMPERVQHNSQRLLDRPLQTVDKPQDEQPETKAFNLREYLQTGQCRDVASARLINATFRKIRTFSNDLASPFNVGTRRETSEKQLAAAIAELEQELDKNPDFDVLVQRHLEQIYAAAQESAENADKQARQVPAADAVLEGAKDVTQRARLALPDLAGPEQKAKAALDEAQKIYDQAVTKKQDTSNAGRELKAARKALDKAEGTAVEQEARAALAEKQKKFDEITSRSGNIAEAQQNLQAAKKAYQFPGDVYYGTKGFAEVIGPREQGLAASRLNAAEGAATKASIAADKSNYLAHTLNQAIEAGQLHPDRRLSQEERQHYHNRLAEITQLTQQFNTQLNNNNTVAEEHNLFVLAHHTAECVTELNDKIKEINPQSHDPRRREYAAIRNRALDLYRTIRYSNAYHRILRADMQTPPGSPTLDFEGRIPVIPLADGGIVLYDKSNMALYPDGSTAPVLSDSLLGPRTLADGRILAPERELRVANQQQPLQNRARKIGTNILGRLYT